MLFMGTWFLKNLGDMAAEQTIRLLSLNFLNNFQSSADILRPFSVICGVCFRYRRGQAAGDDQRKESVLLVHEGWHRTESQFNALLE